MSLSEAIKNIRMQTLLSQDDFAKEIQVTVGTINRWENGKTLPNISAMKKLRSFCEKYNLSYSEIQSEWISSKEEQHG